MPKTYEMQPKQSFVHACIRKGLKINDLSTSPKKLEKEEPIRPKEIRKNKNKN